ncbi:DUF501 domain-containing protein [Aestuariimicrobium kwangyangense]|uniref:DUF501 domain-containing protein n=1 Tax=Aestuariimicrobium kwangyangense TaxID=396389 RepID=UPI00068797F8|nr:DUF501 domain-containing protein [Aestuariimicrobium kwangyangense]
MTDADLASITEQLGREPRGVVGIAWRCTCGRPGVVVTEPRLPNGTPFPTTYYLTCSRLASAIGTLEASGLMAEMSERLLADEALAANYRSAHESYLADRDAVAERSGLGEVPEIRGISAGGMPTRVKCLHVLAAHSLAKGEGVNLLGDETVVRLADFFARHTADDTDQSRSLGATAEDRS